MEPEEEGWWVTCVEPGGISAGGKTPEEARLKFKEAFLHFLFDLAEECDTFHSYSARLHKLLRQRDEPTLELWNESLRRIRENESHRRHDAVSALGAHEVDEDSFQPKLKVSRIDQPARRGIGNRAPAPFETAA